MSPELRRYARAPANLAGGGLGLQDWSYVALAHIKHPLNSGERTGVGQQTEEHLLGTQVKNEVVAWIRPGQLAQTKALGNRNKRPLVINFSPTEIPSFLLAIFELWRRGWDSNPR